jgi:hypothetical protein
VERHPRRFPQKITPLDLIEVGFEASRASKPDIGQLAEVGWLPDGLVKAGWLPCWLVSFAQMCNLWMSKPRL